MVRADGAQLFGEHPADPGGDGGVLEQQRALEELAAVQARTQDEMAFKQGVGLAKEIKQFLAHERFGEKSASGGFP